MRTLLLASLTISALQNPADACGPYGARIRTPKVVQLTSHYIPESFDGVPRRPRTFALLGEPPPLSTAWVRVAPDTYDFTRIAKAPDLVAPMEITLIGPAGSRIVSSRGRMFLAPGFGIAEPSLALEVEPRKGKFEFALVGRHAAVTWNALDGDVVGGAVDLAWAKAHAVTPLRPQGLYVSKLAGTQLEVVTVLTKDGTTTLLRTGNNVRARFEGRVLGGFTLGGEQFVVRAGNDRAVSAFHVY